MWVKDFVIYLDAICNIFTLIPSGPVAFPNAIDDISFWTYSSVISGNVHFPSSELIQVKWILSSTEPRGVALLTKRSPTVEKCSLNISAMSARSSTTSPCWERRELDQYNFLFARENRFSFFPHNRRVTFIFFDGWYKVFAFLTANLFCNRITKLFVYVPVILRARTFWDFVCTITLSHKLNYLPIEPRHAYLHCHLL